QVGVKFQTLFGGNITLLEELCESTRAEAFAHAVDHARALGANALIAIRYDATEIMAGVSEVLCYGTAVRVAPRLRPTSGERGTTTGERRTTRGERRTTSGETEKSAAARRSPLSARRS